MIVAKLKPLLTLLLIAGLAGCALYPAVQVAGGAMTGYDAAVIADDYLPRNKVEGGGRCTDEDGMLERRLRERLRMNNLATSAHVIESNAYLVGEFPSRSEADNAVKTARSVQGLRTITCRFYPITTARDLSYDAELAKKITARFKATKRLEGADLRVEVVQRHVILIGETADHGQKTAAVAIASEVGGILDVIDYISVAPTPQQEADGKVASR